MPQFVIQGPQRLSGEIAVSGAKNAALIAIPAALLSNSPTTLKRIPKINDASVMLDIVKKLGARVEVRGDEVFIDPTTLNSHSLSRELSGKVRASVLFIGSLLLRFGEARIGHPGGCAIGRRPIDQFLEGFKALGVEIEDDGEEYRFIAKKLKATKYFFPFISVTATQSMMMTATRVSGVTTLKNAAAEPEVVALADYLNRCGARVSGAGTSTIHIEGVDALRGSEYTMIPDRLETGMFAILAAATRSPITITQCNPEHVESLLTILSRMGIPFKQGADYLTISAMKEDYHSPGKVITHEYPGFPTDLQPPLTVLLTQTPGTTLVHETIFEGRLFYVDLLNRMGANIILCDPHRALVQGPTPLRGKRIESPDIRAGIAMVIAALLAEGETVIDNIYQIERGYENIGERFKGLGIKIQRIA